MKNYMYGSSTESPPASAFLVAWMIPAERNPDMIIFLASSVSKKLKIFFSVSKWIGFSVVSRKSTEMC